MILFEELNCYAINNQNFRFWTRENPHWMQEVHKLRMEKINVCAGFVGSRILRLYMFKRTQTLGLRFALIRPYFVLALLLPNSLDSNLLSLVSIKSPQL